MVSRVVEGQRIVTILTERKIEMAAVLLFHHALGVTPGNQHYFADNSLPSYDAQASALLMQWVLAFLAAR